MEKLNRGFAMLSPERKREIASKGGRAAHDYGKAYKWNSEQARAAGRKGGSATRDNKRSLPKGDEKPGN